MGGKGGGNRTRANGGPPGGGHAAAGAPPAKIADLAASCVRFVKAKYRVAPDYSPDTLSLVDRYVTDAREDVAARPEALDVIQAAVGAYFGEVVRRTFGATWSAEGDPAEWKLLLVHVYLSFNPVAIARAAVLEGDEEGWSAHFKTDPDEKDIVLRRLASLPPVPEEEYYLPTTRFDVLQMVHDALRAHMEKNGTGDVTFDPEDYDD